MQVPSPSEFVIRGLVDLMTSARIASSKRSENRARKARELAALTPIEVARLVVAGTDKRTPVKWACAPETTRKRFDAMVRELNSALDTHAEPGRVRANRNALVRAWRQNH